MSAEFDVRLVAYNPSTGAKEAILYDATDIQASFVLNDVGALKFTYNKRGMAFSLLTASWAEVALEYTFDDGASWWEPYGGRFIRSAYSHDLMEVAGDAQFEFVSWGFLLSRIILSTATLNADGDRVFGSKNPAGILRIFIDEAQARGTCTSIVSNTFSLAMDSASRAWTAANVQTIGYKPGTDMMQAVDDLVELGFLDWTTDGRSINFYDAPGGGLGRDGTHVGDPVKPVLRAGVEIDAAPDRVDDTNKVNRVYGFGDHNATFNTIGYGGIMPPPWGNLEMSYNRSGTDATALSKFNTGILLQHDDNLVQKTRQTSWAVGGIVLFRDLRQGDYIQTVVEPSSYYIPGPTHNPGQVPGQGGIPQVISTDRVVQITIETKNDGNVSGSLILSSRHEQAQIKQGKLLAALAAKLK